MPSTLGCECGLISHLAMIPVWMFELLYKLSPQFEADPDITVTQHAPRRASSIFFDFQMKRARVGTNYRTTETRVSKT